MYDALFETATSTLLDLAASRWRALPGITAVLHTWTRDLRLHPHVHLLVTAGGLAFDGARWIHRRRFLSPLDIMAEVFRGKMLDALRCLQRQGVFARYPDFEDPEAFGRLLATVATRKWIVHTKEPFRRAEHVLRYLGRYTHRVAISNSRFLAVSPTAVTFRTRGNETATLTPIEFLRRFVQHVLPDGFHKIRHYGLYASANAATRWVVALERLRGTEAAAASVPATAPDASPPSWQEQLLALTGRDARRCPRCGGLLDRRPLPHPPPAIMS
jgi:hypothetical protein